MSDYLTPIKAIRARCIDCCAGQKGKVKLCPPVTDCSLHRAGSDITQTESPEATFGRNSGRLWLNDWQNARLTKNSIVE